jgi:hypothetical protein
MSAPRHYFAGRDLWNAPEAKLLQSATAFKRYLHRNYRTFASITHRFGRRLTLTGWVVGRNGGGGGAGGRHQCFLELSNFRGAGLPGLGQRALHALGPAAISLERILPKFGSVGETLRYRIRVRNDGASRRTR